MKRTTRLLSLLLALILCLSVLPVGASAVGAVGWVKDTSDQWFYYYEDGTVATDWKKIGDYWYRFDSNGVMTTGWLWYDNSWFYLDLTTGQKATGWKEFPGVDSGGGTFSYWRYFGSEGRMVDGWQKIGDYWYRFDEGGVMLTGWYNSDPNYYATGSATGNWFYLDPVTGRMTVGWRFFDSGSFDPEGNKITDSYWAYFDAKGIQVVGGWKQIGSYWYRFDGGGRMLTGWYNSDPDFLDSGSSTGNWFYLDPVTGRMTVGWRSFEDTMTDADGNEVTYTYWMYFNEKGIRLKGWQQIGDYWYRLDSDGVMLTGWYNSDPDFLTSGSTNGSWFYLDPVTGRMAVGWKYLSAVIEEEDGSTHTEDYWAYFDENGKQVIGRWQKVGDYWYYLDQYGRMLSDSLLELGENKYYYFLSNGRMATGWQLLPVENDDGSVTNEWFYFQDNGRMMLSGWLKIGDYWYYFTDSRYSHNGLEEIDGGYYFFQDNGRMLANDWKKIDGTWRYFGTNGKMLKSGLLTWKNKKYYFKDYVMQANCWVNNYFFGSDGAMLVNTTQTIGGTKYTFDAKGNSTPKHI